MSPDTFTRRSALRGLAVAAAAGVVGFVVGHNSAAARGKRVTTAANGYGAAPGGGGELLARLDRIPADGGLILADDKIVLSRGQDGTVHGLSAVCTHQGCTVTAVEKGAVVCPCHGSKFDAQTGAVVAGPATRALPAVAVVVRDGGVYTA
jgi:Rieske Fe-S protein